MRVAIALGGTDRGFSGLSTWVRAVMPRLAGRAGHEVMALGTRRDLDAYAGALAGVREVPLPALCDSPGVSALWHLGWAGHVARREGADVLLLPAANRRASARSPLPTVAVVHDLAPLVVPGKYDRLRTLYVRTLVLGSLRSATVLVAVSESTRAEMARELPRDVAGIRLVKNGVEAGRFTPPVPGDARVARARSEAGLTGPYLLYPARFEHPGKNHLRLLRAFAASAARRTHRLVLVGKDWGAEQRVREEIAQLGLAQRVLIRGYVSDEVLPGLVAGADAVAMLGLSEGFGLPALEALAAARVLVASSTGALPEVAGPLAVYCDPLDERSISRALDRAVLDPGLRERALREGPARAKGFSWDSTAEGVASACAEALRS